MKVPIMMPMMVVKLATMTCTLCIYKTVQRANYGTGAGAGQLRRGHWVPRAGVTSRRRHADWHRPAQLQPQPQPQRAQQKNTASGRAHDLGERDLLPPGRLINRVGLRERRQP
jgi:hypothetical protein